MGFFSGLKKAFKSVTKGVGKVFKKVAKGVKGLAKGIWKGIKGAVKGVGQLMGKLGPIGTIALSFALPGIGTMLGGMWTSAAGAMSAYSGIGSTVINAVGQGMTWAANAATTVGGYISKGYDTITSKITEGLNYVGGGIKEGAANMWTKAKEFVGLPSDQVAKIPDAGKWITEGAKENMAAFAPKQSPLTGPIADSPFRSVSDIALNETGAASKVSTFVAPKASPLPGGFVEGAMPTVAGVAQAQEAVTKGLTPEPSLMDKILKGAANAFGSDDAKPMAMPYMPVTGGDISQTQSNRFGIGGTGSAGGQFLDPTILAMLQANAKQLEAVG